MNRYSVVAAMMLVACGGESGAGRASEPIASGTDAGAATGADRVESTTASDAGSPTALDASDAAAAPDGDLLDRGRDAGVATGEQDAGPTMGERDAEAVTLDAGDAGAPGWRDAHGDLVDVVVIGGVTYYRDPAQHLWLIDHATWTARASRYANVSTYFESSDCSGEAYADLVGIVLGQVFQFNGDPTYRALMAPQASVALSSIRKPDGSCDYGDFATYATKLSSTVPASPITGSGQAWVGPLTE